METRKKQAEYFIYTLKCLIKVVQEGMQKGEEWSLTTDRYFEEYPDPATGLYLQRSQGLGRICLLRKPPDIQAIRNWKLCYGPGDYLNFPDREQEEKGLERYRKRRKK